MISSEVQRTLVKSPPELWAELSDPSALARHLGELGEIRITRTEAEKLVEWEAEGTKGTVAIKASGWGTKVTLSVSREILPPGPEATDEETHAVEAGLAEARHGVAAVSELDIWASQEVERVDRSITAAERFACDDPEPLLGTGLASEHGPEAFQLESHTAPSVETHAPGKANGSPEPRRGFLARLFGRRRERGTPLETVTKPEPISNPTAEPLSMEQAIFEPTPTGIDAPAQTPAREPPTEAVEKQEQPSAPVAREVSTEDPEPSQTSVADLAAELARFEEAASDEVTAVLTGMLDRLGAAHHRPFSRS